MDVGNTQLFHERFLVVPSLVSDVLLSSQEAHVPSQPRLLASYCDFLHLTVSSVPFRDTFSWSLQTESASRVSVATSAHFPNLCHKRMHMAGDLLCEGFPAYLWGNGGVGAACVSASWAQQGPGHRDAC